jgi:DNA polymerase elongation subunit (family B)
MNYMNQEANYVGAAFAADTDSVLIWERPVAGGRRIRQSFAAPRYFYVPDTAGQYRSITGEQLRKIECPNEADFIRQLRRSPIRFESDIQPEARVLMDSYYGRPTPATQYAFLDIEVDYQAKQGFSSPENPYAPINAVTIYQSWKQCYMTYAVPPVGWNATEILHRRIVELFSEHSLALTPMVQLCKSERELLMHLISDIEDADIISGWNSGFFDIPYLVKRLELQDGQNGAAQLCFDGASGPQPKMVQRFGSQAMTYVLYGRTHLDYLELFKKFTFGGRLSYSLASIAADELKVAKLAYPGTLEELYNNDFAHFITYNVRDVEILVKLDEKFKLMQLANQMAHENTVPFSSVLGTVRYVETGIVNRAHAVHHLIVTDRPAVSRASEKVEGALVLVPRAGLWDWIGSIDITSLYPSVIRALNLSIETFVGQFREEEEAWRGISQRSNKQFTCDLVDGPLRATGAEWADFVRETGYALSAFGTLFNQSRPGMVADALTYWFEERVRLQAEKKKFASLAQLETDPEGKAELQKRVEELNLLQQTKKYQLNSTYGALLNEFFRFGRRELGASVTSTGRQITKHMTETVAKAVTKREWSLEKRFANFKHADREEGPFEEGEAYSRLLRAGDFGVLQALPTVPAISGKPYGAVASPAIWFTECPAIIYGDTDSCYFLTYARDYDEAVTVADGIARLTNESFPALMREAFNCTEGREKLINVAREIVAERGLFMIAKKKYTLRVVNSEGFDCRQYPRLKSMGSEIKKTDTPKVIQDFLKGLMDLVLTGRPYSDLERYVNDQRGTLMRNDEYVLSLAAAKQVNNLERYTAAFEIEKAGGAEMKRCPGHVRAAINYNEMLALFGGTDQPIRGGEKAATVYLRPNDFGFTSMSFPLSVDWLPDWFKAHFSIDLHLTEQKMIDAKIEGIFEALGQEVPTPQSAHVNSVFTF